MLSLLKVGKMTKNAVLNYFVSVVAPSDATEKNRYIDAQLHSILYTAAQKDFGKFTSCRTFGAHKLVHSEPFLYELSHLLSALRSDELKFFFI